MAKRKPRVGILVAVGAGALVILSAPLWGSYLGRRIAWFDVDRVEIAGARLVAPHELLAASGIRAGHSILDDSEPWEAALRSHPAIAGVRISRRAPSTLRIRVEEKQPVAFVGDDVLALATGDGEILPVDPSAAPVDLPIVRGDPRDSAQDVNVRRLLAETARLLATDPAVLAEISEVRLAPEEQDVLLLIHPVGEILLPFGASESRLAELRAVLADISRRRPAVTGAAASGPRTRLDLRFDEQVVVRHPPPRELS